MESSKVFFVAQLNCLRYLSPIAWCTTGSRTSTDQKNPHKNIPNTWITGGGFKYFFYFHLDLNGKRFPFWHNIVLVPPPTSTGHWSTMAVWGNHGSQMEIQTSRWGSERETPPLLWGGWGGVVQTCGWDQEWSTGSTIRTLLHGKINPKDWQVASPLVMQGFSNFLGLFQVIMANPDQCTVFLSFFDPCFLGYNKEVVSRVVPRFSFEWLYFIETRDAMSRAVLVCLTPAGCRIKDYKSVLGKRHEPMISSAQKLIDHTISGDLNIGVSLDTIFESCSFALLPFCPC